MASKCPACPFRRTSAEGWLGDSENPAEFFWPIWNEVVTQPCHKAIDWDAGDKPDDSSPLCRGAIAMMKNAGKLPRNFKLSEAVSKADKDPEVFNYPHEFLAHHGGK